MNKLPVIGILGSGQLAAMMSRAYQKLGGQSFVYGDSKNSPAGSVADRFFEGAADDKSAMAAFLRQVDVATLENEFFPSAQLEELVLATGTPLFPEVGPYREIEDKLSEKRYFESLGVVVAPYREILSAADLSDQPGYLKLAKGGYDGIGTYKVRNFEQANEVYERIKASGQVLFEEEIHYKKELSLVAVSGAEGNVFYPLVETHQDTGTCRYVSYPASVRPEVETQAQHIVQTILEAMNTRGVFAFELFLTHEDQLILNESAPRPHNSGHITMDLHDHSQFDSHMRAVAGLTLASPEANYPAALMVNLLATRSGDFDVAYVEQTLDQPNQRLELYGKTTSRPKRKMGHINLWGDDLWQRAKDIVSHLDI